MNEQASWESRVRNETVISADGTRIAYQVVGDGEDVILLANGLGGRLYAWGPLIERYHRTHRILCWDYRGLFDSAHPKTHRELAINRHVDDAVAILRKEEHESALVVGWSMGVQVALDLAATHPDLVAGLVLLNGTHGHAFRTAMQPLFEVPGLDRVLHAAVDRIRKQPVPMPIVRSVARRMEPLYLAAFAFTAGRRAFSLQPVLHRYLEDTLGESFDNYMHLFQELDAHSVYHVLPNIETPTLVISGLLDPLTPARQSFDIARRLPNAEHLPIARAGHFALLERPEVVLPAIDRFLRERVRFAA